MIKFHSVLLFVITESTLRLNFQDFALREGFQEKAFTKVKDEL